MISGTKGARFLATLLLTLIGARAFATTLPTGFTEANLPRPDGAQQWNEAVGIAFTPSGRMFVWERTGRVWIIDQTNPVTTPFLDIAPEVLAWHDHGMLGFALSPAFEQNGFVYVLYMADRHHVMNCDSPVDGAPVCNGSYSASTTWLPDAQWLDPPTNTVPNPGFKKASLGRVVRYQAVKPPGDPDYRRATTIDYSTRHILIGETTIAGPKNTGFTLTHDSHGIGSLVFAADGTLLVSDGDSATYNSADTGSVAETYFQSALDDGFWSGPKENVGALRAQLIDSMNGKLMRIDPVTGDGIAGNPFYDATAPRAPRSRVWAYGLRNPYRFTIRPGTGSHLREDANPGVIYLGDVGWSTWEDLHIIKTGGENLGWPLYEGQTSNSSYNSAGSRKMNLDAPNPLFGIGGCTQQFFFFQDMLKQQSLNAPSWPNPCNTSQQIPASVHPAVHSRPALDWNHSSTTLQSRFPAFDLAGNAVAQQLGTTAPDGTTVAGSPFQGNTSTGGVFYTGTQFPTQYRNTYFHGDYGGQWIKSMVVDDNNRLLQVQDFASGAGGVVEMGMHPTDGSLYYIAWTAFVRKVSYSPPGGQPPVALASAKPTYGTSPLTVQFSSAGSNDPDGGAVTFTWDFGDGSPTSTAASPSHLYTTATTAITNFDATLTVRDSTGLQTQTSILISLNNTPPVVHITSPVNGSRYSLASLTPVSMTANISDAQTPTQDLICQWQKVLYHTNHEHTDPFDSSCTTSAVISPVGCDGEMYYYGFRLAVSDPYLTTRDETRVFPNCPSGNPTLGADSASVANAGTVAINVLANDSDPDGLNFQSLVIMDQPQHGTIAGINTATGTVTYQHDGSPTASDTFTYTVADSIGAFGVPTTVTISVSGADVTPPTVPQSLQATAASASRINLSWNASTDTGGSGVAGYRVYRDGGAAPIATVTATTFANTGLAANTSYSYTVRSFDNAGNESANSNVAAASTLPAPSWVDQDIGAVAAAGSFTNGGASVTITGSGADIWGTADEFHFAYRPLDGDGELVARVTALTAGHMWSKVGLMVRESVAANSRHGTMFLGALKGAAFQYRINNGGSSAGDNGDSITTIPRWIRIQRQGAVIRGYFSSDGTNWTQRGTVTLTGLPTSVLIGIAYTSHVDGTIGSSTLDNVTLTGSEVTPDTTPPTVPTNLQASAISTSRIDLTWTASTDTGGSGLSGYRVFRNGGATPIATVTTSSYSDTGLTANTQYTYTVRAVDGANNVSADSVSASATTQATPPPDTTAPSVPQNLQATAVGPTRIDLTWTASTDNAGGSGLAGYRIFRDGGTTPIATVTTTSYSNTSLTANTSYTYQVRAYDNATNESALSGSASATTAAAASWSNSDIGAVAAAGSFTDNGTSLSITGSGADIWGTADEFQFAYRTLDGDGQMTARVTALSNGNVWSKVGLMVRESVAAGSRHGTMFLGSGKGASFQYRVNNGGTSAGDNGDLVLTIPRWIRIERAGTIVRGFFSADGVTWTQRGTITLTGLPTSVLIGVAYTSHVDGSVGSATLDNVSVTGSNPPVQDTTAPTVPLNLQATAMSTSRIDLTWTASTDTGGSGLAGYRVFRNGGTTPIATVSTTSFSDTGLAASTLYTYTVRAVDGASNVSADSAPASATTQSPPAPDTTPPGVPANLQASAVGGSRIDLTWSAVTDNAGGSGLAGYRIFRDGGSTPIATVTATSYSNTSLTPNTSYTYVVRSYDNAGNESASSGTASATTGSAATWSNGDIGAVAAAGSFTDNGASLSISGSGADIWGTADEFQFAYRTLTGDGELVARVNTITNPNTWSKVGMMVRESLAASSRHGTMYLAAGKGSSFQYRQTNGGTSAGDNGDNVLTLPRWIRIQRAGDVVTGAVSTDGVNWTQRGTITMASLPATVYVGIAMTSHLDGTIATATLDSVSLNLVTPPVPDTTAPSVPQSLTATSGTAANFAPQVSYAAGTNSHSVATADLNGDGKLDLAVVNAASDNVSVFFGNGNGTFGAGTPWPVGNEPKSVKVADLNGDGKPDLVTANQGNGSTSVLLGTGAGSFSANVDYPACNNNKAHEVAVADFNRDSRPDLALTCHGNNFISVLLGNGDGTFGAATNFTVGGAPHSLVALDFNGDGNPDVAVANLNTDNVSVRLGNGTGGFAAAVNYTVGDGPHAIRAGDLNGDGKLDLVTANENSNNLTVLLGGPNGTFTVLNSFPTGIVPKGIVIVDIDGDGALDVVNTDTGGNYPTCCKPGGDQVSVLYGNGTGNLSARQDFTVGLTPFSITSGDFNNDGRPDLATANWHGNSASVLINQSGSRQVQLSWQASTDNAGGTGVAGYEIYRNGTLLTTSTANSYTDRSVTPGTSYTYTVRAFDAATPANFSAQSAAANVTP